MDFKGFSSLSPAKRVLIFFALGVVSLVIPTFIDEAILLIWGVAQLAGAVKASKLGEKPKDSD